ncbi:MAG: alpha-ribazole phosphatase [Paludibacter sp.]|nr:alpha-ribazole phosphatase [Paludibacter sp.]
MQITFIRHTSVAVPTGICYGQSDVDVSPTFETEAQQVLSKLQGTSFDAVYCSPLARCRKLAYFCGFPAPVIDTRLMELNFGAWEMKPWANINDPQLQPWFDNWLTEIPTKGESFQQLIFRVEEFLNEIKKIPFQHIAIFTHAGVIRAAGIITGRFQVGEAFDYQVLYGDLFKIIL